MFKRLHARDDYDAQHDDCHSERARTLELLLRERESVRMYDDEPLDLPAVSQLLWSAQGIAGPSGRRTTPSAGALYPLTVYAVVGNVMNLAPAVYAYSPREHNLALALAGDMRELLCAAAHGQQWIRHAPLDLVLTANYEETAARYHDRGTRYVQMEAGHAAQNVYLLATALGLGTLAVGAFDDDMVSRALQLSHDRHPLYIMPIGKRRALTDANALSKYG